MDSPMARIWERRLAPSDGRRTCMEKSWDLQRNLLREDQSENKSLDSQMDT
jgi:hypothetical protein